MLWMIGLVAILIVAAIVLSRQSNRRGDPQRATALSRIALVLTLVALVLAAIAGADLAQEYGWV